MWTGAQLKEHIKQLCADSIAMKAYAQEIRERHNDFVKDVGIAIREHTTQIKQHNHNCQATINEFRACKQHIDNHQQELVDCKTFVDARDRESKEIMMFLKEGLDKFATNGADRLTFLEQHLVPDAIDSVGEKVAKELQEVRDR